MSDFGRIPFKYYNSRLDIPIFTRLVTKAYMKMVVSEALANDLFYYHMITQYDNGIE